MIPWTHGWITGFLTLNKPNWSKEHDAAIRQAATLAAQNRGALVDLGITQGMLYEFCEWFCEHNCEEAACKITVSYLHERMEGIKKQMTEHPEYLAKWEKKRDEQKAILRQTTIAGEEQGKGVLCRYDDQCDYQVFDTDTMYNAVPITYCGREAATLALSEEPEEAEGLK